MFQARCLSPQHAECDLHFACVCVFLCTLEEEDVSQLVEAAEVAFLPPSECQTAVHVSCKLEKVSQEVLIRVAV